MKPPKNLQSRVTIRQIATETKLHFTTVSLALRNSPRLLPETRKRVQKIARKMGYKPDPMLAALNAYRISRKAPHYQATIGWINNWPGRDDLLANREFREYYLGACERAQELGYSVEQFWLRESGMTPQKLDRILRARSIHALLLPPQPASHVNPMIDFKNYSAVAFGYSMQPSVLNVVTNHHFHSINLTFHHLNLLGYRRVALSAYSDWDEKVGNAWTAGLLLAKAKYPDMTLISPLLSKKQAKQTLQEWLEANKPEVLISYTEMIKPLRDMGYSIPDKLGFSALDVSPDEAVVSGIHQNDRLIGKKAIDILVGMLHRNERGMPEVQVSTLVEGTWRPGKTLKQN